MAGLPGSPAVLLLHATGGHWEQFSANLGPLSQQFTCCAFDMIGCGLTDKPDRPYEIGDYADHAVSVLDALDIPLASVVGVSLGSWVAARLAHDHPQRVERLILATPAGLIKMPSDQISTIRAAPLMSDPSWQNIRTAMESLLYRPDAIPEALLDDIVAVRHRSSSEHPNLSRILTLFEPVVRERNQLTETEWKEIAAPTLIVEHLDENDYWRETAQRLAELIPSVVSVGMHGVGHWPPFERPETFNALASEFLLSGTVADTRPR
jgi:pimeloyl-ACP methyl ester carboxylesterase